jgi:hypothetical protein
MRLEEHQIATPVCVRAAEEVMQAGFENLGSRRVGGDVSAKLTVGLVGPDDHGECVPTHDRRQPLLQRHIAGMDRLLVERNAVLVSRVRHHMRHDTEALRLLLQLCEQVQTTLAATARNGGAQRVQPFPRLLRVDVVRQIHAANDTD